MFKFLSRNKKQTSNSTIEKLELNQLKKVVGGGGGDSVDGSVTGAINTTRSNIRSPS